MDSETTVETFDCIDCRQPFTRHVYHLLGRVMGARRCPACEGALTTSAERERDAARAKARDAKWMKACPTIYRDTNPADSRLNQAALALSQAWPTTSTRGLGFIGTTGKGKTRCLFLALRRAHAAGSNVAAISHTKFSRVAMDAFSGDAEEKAIARERLKHLHTADVVLIDDLGKPPSTERADSELEELVEDRTSEALPILWSANGSGEWLIKRFGVDRGEPTVRRLAEFSEVLTLE